MAKKKITKITSSDEVQESKIQNTTEPTKTDLVDAIKIVDTMEFYFPNDDFVALMKEELKKEDCSNLTNARIICFELKLKEGDKLSDFKGIDLALEKLTQNPDAPMILTSFIDITGNALDEKRNKLDLLLSKPNVKFIRLPFTLSSLINLFAEQQEDQNRIAQSEIAFQDILEREVGIFLHSARYEIPDYQSLTNLQQLEFFFVQGPLKKSLKSIDFENKLIGLLQLQYPMYKDISREMSLSRIVDIYKFIMQKELPEGTAFAGVFVDRDGSLYDNEKKQFNQKVIDMIHEYEKQGKDITIRTLGDIESKQKQLDDAGLPYQVKSKIDYKGATVELAIDDESPEKLFANARVKAQKHIQV